MLHDLKTIAGAPVFAIDGKIGTISSFLLDDRTWMIRYLVVDVRSRMMRQDVVLEIAAVERADWTKNTFHLHLTKEQVRESPDIDTERSVSREQELAMMEYFGRMAYWLDSHSGLLSSTPTGREYSLHTKGDAHLRNVWKLMEYRVTAGHDEIGRLSGFILDGSSWHLGYLEVKAGDWLGCRSVLVPTHWVESISWADHWVNLHPTASEHFRLPRTEPSSRKH